MILKNLGVIILKEKKETKEKNKHAKTREKKYRKNKLENTILRPRLIRFLQYSVK